MATVATLTLTATTLDQDVVSFAFETFPSSTGYPSQQNEHQEEELTTPGVNGKRWRTIFDQVPQIVVEEGTPAWSTAASHVAACLLADRMRLAVGRFGELAVTSGGTRTVRFPVHVTSCLPRAVPGVLVTTTASYGGAVASSWVLDVLET